MVSAAAPDSWRNRQLSHGVHSLSHRVAGTVRVEVDAVTVGANLAACDRAARGRLIAELCRDGLGHGAVATARVLPPRCVAAVWSGDEALELRRAGYPGALLVMEPGVAADALAAVPSALAPGDVDALRAGRGSPFNLWFDAAHPELLAETAHRAALAGLRLHAFGGRRPTSMGADHWQVSVAAAVACVAQHLDVTATVLHFHDDEAPPPGGWMRAGLALYGLPAPDGSSPAGVLPAATVAAPVTHVLQDRTGRRFARLAVGRDDGIPTFAAGRVHVLIAGEEAPVVRVDANHTVVALAGQVLARGSEALLVEHGDRYSAAQWSGLPGLADGLVAAVGTFAARRWSSASEFTVEPPHLDEVPAPTPATTPEEDHRPARPAPPAGLAPGERHNPSTSAVAAYDEVAEVYDSFYGTETAVVAEDRWAADAAVLHAPAGTIVVDLGCGTGHFVDVSQLDPSRYLGIDVSAGMLQRARAKHPAHRFLHADINALCEDPALAGIAGAVVCTYGVPSYLHDGDQQFARVLRHLLHPDGYALVMPYAPGRFTTGRRHVLDHHGIDAPREPWKPARLARLLRAAAPSPAHLVSVRPAASGQPPSSVDPALAALMSGLDVIDVPRPGRSEWLVGELLPAGGGDLHVPGPAPPDRVAS